MKPSLRIDIAADIVCPWCYIGLQSYWRAAEDLRQDFELTTQYRVYMLNPDHPLEGMDRVQYYAAKFPDPERRSQMADAMAKSASEIGVDFDPSIPTRLPNTRLAHQFIRYAQIKGVGDVFIEKLYEAYWRNDADIGDEEQLCALAEAAGMEVKAAKMDVPILADEAMAMRRGGVDGVPTFIVNSRTGFAGALPPDQLLGALRHAASINEKGMGLES